MIRVDTLAAPVPAVGEDSDEAPNGIVGTDALPGGGYITSWVADSDGDGRADAIAIQHFAANGAKVGGIVLLDDVPSEILQAASSDEAIVAVSVDPLAGGGYAVSYQLDAPEDSSSTVLIGSPAGFSDFLFVGKPGEFYIGGDTAGLTFTLNGVDAGGNPLSIAITPQILESDYGRIFIDPAVFDQFGNDARLSLRVTGLANGSPLYVSADISAINQYDDESALQTVSQSGSTTIYDNVNGFAVATFFSRLGRAEAFDINAITPKSGTTPLYSLGIVASEDLRSALGLGGNGSSVTRDGLTYTQTSNGSITVTGAAIVPNGSGVVTVPGALLGLLDSLDNPDASIFLNVLRLEPGSTFQGDVSVRIPTVLEPGIYTQTYDAAGTGGATVRVDTLATTPMSLDDDDIVLGADTDALANGGYVTSWLADADGDREADAIAVQRFLANGTKDGGPVLIQDFVGTMLPGYQHTEIISLSIDPLVGGGYAATYQVEAPESGFWGGIVATGSTANDFFFVGKPSAFYLTGNGTSLEGLTFSLVGVDGGGNPISVVITPQDVDGNHAEFAIDERVFDQFGNDARLSLRVTGLANGGNITVNGEAAAIFQYDGSSPTQTATVNQATILYDVANGYSRATISSRDGRVEGFDIDAITPKGGTTPLYSLGIIASSDFIGALGLLPNNPQTINGLTYVLNISGIITVTGAAITPDGSGVLTVPADILNLLDSLETPDASIFLNVLRLEPGSTVQADVTVRLPYVVQDGLYSQTYDANGNANAAVHIDTPSTLPVHLMLDDDAPLVDTDALANGGFLSSWVVDTDGDGDADTIALQKFAADGSKDGGVAVIDGLGFNILRGEGGENIAGLALDPLADGNYAVSYQVAAPTYEFDATLTAQSAGIAVAGKPRTYTFNGNLAGLTFQLSGVDANGSPVTVSVTPQVLESHFAELTFDAAIFDQFGNDARIFLRVVGLSPGATLDVYGSVGSIFQYDEFSPLRTTTVDVATTIYDPVNGFAVAAIGSPDGRAESFDVHGFTAKSGQTAAFSLNVAASDELRFALGLNVPNTPVIIGGLAYIYLPQGTISVSGAGLTPDANGIVRVPQALLDALSAIDEQDASIGLIITKLQPGSHVQADVTTRLPYVVEEGVFTEVHQVGTSGNDTLTAANAGQVLHGAAGQDLLIGGSGNDHLYGGTGNDQLLGGAGSDVAGFAGSYAASSVIRLANGTIRVTNMTDGTDLLKGVEQLRFSDREVDVHALVRTDVNGDGDSDVVYYSASSGSIGKFAMENGIRQGAGSYLGDMGSGAWDIRATGDFTNDGTGDLVLKNALTGQFYIWTVQNGVQTGGGNLGVIGTSWDVRSTGDYNADGVADLLWRDASNGHAYIWTMSASLTQTGGTSLGILGAEWDLGQSGDFDGDGDSDVLLRNSNNGQVYIYSMNNGAVSSGASLGVLGTSWTLAGTGDYNGDGRSDVALKNTATGQFYLFQMNQDLSYEGSNLGVIGTDWTIAASGDYNKDGTDDILWRNASTGLVYLWQMDNGHQASAGSNSLGFLSSDLVIV